MKKRLTKIGLMAIVLGALFIPLSVTHAQYMSYYGSTMPYYTNTNYNNNYSSYNSYPMTPTYYSSGYNYGYNYNYSNSSYNSYPYNYSGSNYNYNSYPYSNNYNNNYGYNYNPYGSNYNYYPSEPEYTVSHLCGPNSVYNPSENLCDCYSGYISQNNICVSQAVAYSYNNNYEYGYNNNSPWYDYNNWLKPVALCNDGSTSYSEVGTCWLNGGVRQWLN